MDVTININAPAIVDAINRLSEVFGKALNMGVPSQIMQDPNVSAAPEYEVIEPKPAQDTATAPTQPVPQPQPNTAPPIADAPQTVVQSPQNVQPAVMTPNAVPFQTTVTSPAPTPVVDEAYRNRVCTAAARLVEQGKMSEVLAILQSFGVPAVTHLSATQLPEFANQITALGAVV